MVWKNSIGLPLVGIGLGVFAHAVEPTIISTSITRDAGYTFKVTMNNIGTSSTDRGPFEVHGPDSTERD